MTLMKSNINIFLLAAFLIIFVSSSYRENYIADEQNIYQGLEIWELNIINQESSIDELGEHQLEVQFQIEDKIFSSNWTYVNGWNTSLYFGEFDSEKNLLLKFGYVQRVQSYIYDLKFNLLLINPKNSNELSLDNLSITYFCQDFDYNIFWSEDSG